MTDVYDAAFVQRVRTLKWRSRRHVANDLLGAYRSQHKGHGLEYVESRTYEPGDDVRRMDWKLTARTTVPHLKLFQEERQLRLHFIIDISNSMRFGDRTRTKLNAAMSLALALAHGAVQAQDEVGIALFTDRPEAAYYGIRRVQRFRQVVQDIGGMDAGPYGVRRRTADAEVLAEYVGKLRPLPQIVFLFSDFLPASWFTSAPGRWPRRMTVVPVCVRSAPLDLGRIRLWSIDGETGHGGTTASADPLRTVAGRTAISVNASEPLAPALHRILTWPARA